MFEAELERVRKQLKQQLATSQPYVSIADILGNERVHPAIRSFFRAEVDWWVHEERAIRNSNPRFATLDPVFADVFRRLDALYVDHARFDHEELSAAVDAGAKTWLNYLCRPRVTLRWFVFRGEPTKPLHEILLRLQYLREYRYLTDGFRQWASARSTEASGFEILSVIEFERIIEKIDNDAILDLSQTEFVALLDPLFAFFADYDPDLPPESVPTEAVIIFLDDKGAVPISQALERMLYREDLRTLTRSKLLAVIDDVLASLDVPDLHAGGDVARVTDAVALPMDETLDGPPADAFESLSDAVPVFDASTPLTEGAASPEPVEDAIVEPDEGPSAEEREAPFVEATHETTEGSLAPAAVVTTDDVIEHVQELTTDIAVESATNVFTEDVEETAVASHPDEAPIAGESDNTSSIQTLVDEQTSRRHERLSALLDDRMRERVLKRVFARRSDMLDDILSRVSECGTWKEAAKALDRYYAEHGIEPNTAAAIEFSQAVYRSYLNGNS